MSKLRTYILIKNQYNTEDYVKAHLPKQERSFLAQLRCGVLPLRIFHTIMSWLMTACVRSPVCLACAWILVQACQASVGTDVDGISCFIDATW